MVKRWIPEPDQDILFEHTRLLREKWQLGKTAFEPKRGRDNMGGFVAPSRRDHPDLGPVSDSKHALPERRGPVPPVATRWFEPHSNIPQSESSGAKVYSTEGGTCSSEDEHDERATAAPTDEAEAMAAVNELLEKYMTLFE